MDDIPAFPSTNEVRVDQFMTGGHAGITVRQYFAAHAPITFQDAISALNSVGAQDYTGPDILEMLARLRWDYADRMAEFESGGEE